MADEREKHGEDDERPPTSAGARLSADEGEPEIEPFAEGGEPTDRNPEHGYGYE